MTKSCKIAKKTRSCFASATESLDLFIIFFSKQYIYTKTKTGRKNIKQCPIRYTLDLNRGNVKVKTIIKKILKVK